jgi:flagellar biosynthesis protein
MKRKAVALSYDSPGRQKAPKVIASGEGQMATYICQIAEKHDIEFISDPLLVESLVNVPVGQEIPRELYDSVAIIFRYLLSSENKKNN